MKMYKGKDKRKERDFIVFSLDVISVDYQTGFQQVIGIGQTFQNQKSGLFEQLIIMFKY